MTTDVPSFSASPTGNEYWLDAFAPEQSIWNSEQADLEIAMEELRSVVRGITAGCALPPLADMDELISRAVHLRGRPPNVEKWARQLAADVGEMID
jgi:hypothetical protein